MFCPICVINHCIQTWHKKLTTNTFCYNCSKFKEQQLCPVHCSPFQSSFFTAVIIFHLYQLSCFLKSRWQKDGKFLIRCLKKVDCDKKKPWHIKASFKGKNGLILVTPKPNKSLKGVYRSHSASGWLVCEKKVYRTVFPVCSGTCYMQSALMATWTGGWGGGDELAY